MLTVWQFFIHETGWVAKVVLGILLLFSFASWAIIAAKYVTLKRVKRQNAQFQSKFIHAQRFSDAKALAGQLDVSTLAGLFNGAYAELNSQNKESRVRWDLVEREISRAHRSSLKRLRGGLPFLATTAGATPFIGLFGTVWGIMNAFRQIGLVGTSSLATVAPGISEALINTAAGLFAAIPALIAYNLFVNSIRGISEDNVDFTDQLMVLLVKRLSQPVEEAAGMPGGSR